VLRRQAGPLGAGQAPAGERRPARAAAVRGRWKAASAGGIFGAALRQRLEELQGQLRRHRRALQGDLAGAARFSARQAWCAAGEVLAELEALDANVTLDAHVLHVTGLASELLLAFWQDNEQMPVGLVGRTSSLAQRWKARCAGGGALLSAAERGA